MSERRPLGVQDALWLEMDRPNNLMVVDSVVWTDEPIDWDRYRAMAKERLWDRYPVFRSIAVRDDDRWYWESHPELSFDDHLVHLVLPEPGDERELQAFIASQRTVMLDRDRPLWIAFCIDNYLGGSAVVLRTHHAIADGIRMVELAMTLFDASPEGGSIMGPNLNLHASTPRAPGQQPRERMRAAASDAGRRVADAAGELRVRVGDALADPLQTAVDGLAAVRDAVGAATEASAGAARAVAANPVGAVHTAVTGAVAGLGNLASSVGSAVPRLPGGGPVVDVFSAAPGDVEFARKLLLGTRNDVSMWTGTAGIHKAVAWSHPLPLDEVKLVAKANGATVNDVLVTCVAGVLHAYLEAHHARCASVNWMIPVNLRPFDASLPDQLGNGFALVQLELPTDNPDPLAVLAVVKRRMERIKHGHEAALAFRLQELIGGLNRTLYEASVDLLANRAVGVLTNVPGPPTPVYMAGREVAGICGWAPLSGNQPMSFTIYSYAGKVFVGIACDAGLVPDHEHIVDGFAPAFARLRAASDV